MGLSTHASDTAAPLSRALIPAAGFGSRLRPLTHAIPKEMLPLGRKPVLEYVVEELRAAGIRNLLFVVSPGKEMIARYFGDGSAWNVHCEYVTQPTMRGLGDAILQGEAWTEGEPFAVAFGDCLIESGHDVPPLARLLTTHTQYAAQVTVLCERIARERTRKYGILAPAVTVADAPESPFPLTDIVEKPLPDDAPSTLAVAARYLLDATIFPLLRAAVPGKDGEVNLTDPVRGLLAAGGIGWAVPLLRGEARRDIGGWNTYLEAAAHAALNDAEFGTNIRETLGVPR